MAHLSLMQRLLSSQSPVALIRYHHLHTSSPSPAVHTVQTGGALMLRGSTGTVRAGIGVFVGYRDPENMAMPIADVPADQSPVAVKRKSHYDGRKITAKDDTVVVIPDSVEAVERLRDKFTTPNVEIRCVPRKFVTQASSKFPSDIDLTSYQRSARLSGRYDVNFYVESPRGCGVRGARSTSRARPCTRRQPCTSASLSSGVASQESSEMCGGCSRCVSSERPASAPCSMEDEAEVCEGEPELMHVTFNTE
ncbi:hypothetical protein RvY_00501 [Ramazzottius varieornatus]|uniref:Uncharacterized protein n=1 Tax=Ramazzottius varieornatus TaxID=947166 RepID=A0A1D1UNE1_RAMVA|nr:hypothetical protein RvY_00501 [Ramazzottius varieornatus]